MLSYLSSIHLYFVIHDSQTSLNVLNKDLEMIHNWAFQWKMNFNLDPTKPAQKDIFSRKTKKLPHPPLIIQCYSINISTAPRHHTRLSVNI